MTPAWEPGPSSRDSAAAAKWRQIQAAQEAVREKQAAAERERERVLAERVAVRERFTVGPEKPAVVVQRDVDDLLLSEVGPSVLALVEVRDNPKTRPVDRVKAALSLIERALGPVAGPQVTVNVDSSLMALARRLDGEGLEAVRARAAGELPPGPHSSP